jgi:uncharacterized membrane protein YczE
MSEDKKTAFKLWRNFMNSRKYRVCLIGIIVLALALGIFIYANNAKGTKAPSDGILVQQGAREEKAA